MYYTVVKNTVLKHFVKFVLNHGFYYFSVG